MTPPVILVAGSANLDFVVRAPHIPAPGETVLGGAFRTFPGGKGANQAIACARAGGVATQMLLALGDDSFAAPLETSLRDAGVGLHVLRTADTPTGTAFICVSDDGENAITVAPGANACLAPHHLPQLAGVSHILLQLETPLDTVTAYASAARAVGVTVVLNAAPATALPSELLAAVDLLIVNEGELAVITSMSCDSPADIDAAIAAISVPNVVVTLGVHGARARCGSAQYVQRGFTVQAVDTTAAGDTFCGALVAQLALGADWLLALRVACAAAALACTTAGAQSSIPTHEAVVSFLRTQAAKSA